MGTITRSRRPFGIIVLVIFVSLEVNASAQQSVQRARLTIGTALLNGPTERAIDQEIQRLTTLCPYSVASCMTANLRPLDLPLAKSESEALAELRGLAAKNRVARSFIGAILRHDYAAGDSAKCPGKSRLVYGLYPLSG